MAEKKKTKGAAPAKEAPAATPAKAAPAAAAVAAPTPVKAAPAAPAAAAPVAEAANEAHGFRRKLVGRVTSDKMNKTVVVEVSRNAPDPVYKKYVRHRER
ncbi:MAG: 30S ribosomal protein S17, partial [Minicystis sp.]